MAPPFVATQGTIVMKELLIAAAVLAVAGAAQAQQTHDLRGNYSDSVLGQFGAPIPTARPDPMRTSSVSSMRHHMPADQMDRHASAHSIRNTPMSSCVGMDSAQSCASLRSGR
jgi:hypothetical protein